MRVTPMLLLLALLPAGLAIAAPSASAAASDGSRESELVKRQLELTFQLQDQGRKNEAMWSDARFTSPEIQALRQRYQKLAEEMGEVQAQLRQLVDALPEAQAEREKVERMKAEYQNLARQIEAAKKARGAAAR